MLWTQLKSTKFSFKKYIFGTFKAMFMCPINVWSALIEMLLLELTKRVSQRVY